MFVFFHLKAPDMALYAWIGLVHFLHTKLTWSETPHKLSQHWVKLHIDWVNAEWDSTSAESMRNAPVLTKISSFTADSTDVKSHSALTQLTWSLAWCWVSWWEMRIHINWTTTEWEKVWICQRIQEYNQKTYSLAYIGLILARNQNKKPHASVYH